MKALFLLLSLFLISPAFARDERVSSPPPQVLLEEANYWQKAQTFSGVTLNPAAWDDVRIVPGSFDRPGVSDPSLVSYAISGSTTYAWEFQKDDIANFTAQIPHSYLTGTTIYVHVHWTPGTQGNEENGNKVGWKVDYSWASIDGVFGAIATADLSDACDGTDHKHQMTPEGTIPGDNKGTSSMLICNIKRTDTGTDDTWSNAASGALPLILEIDFHFQVASFGSETK